MTNYTIIHDKYFLYIPEKKKTSDVSVSHLIKFVIYPNGGIFDMEKILSFSLCRQPSVHQNRFDSCVSQLVSCRVTLRSLRLVH